MIYINKTKKTNQAIKIGICYNDENGFLAIQKIIMLLKYLNINATFITISAGLDKYIKGCNNGIEEHDLMGLKNIDLLLHTEFDMSFFNTKLNHKDIKEYLDFALKIVYRENFYNTNTKNYISLQNTEETLFFKQQKQYTDDVFLNEINVKTNNSSSFDKKQKPAFSFGFGKKIICTLNSYNDRVILNFIVELLKKISCEKTSINLLQKCNLFSYKYEKVLENIKQDNEKAKQEYVLADATANIVNIKYKKELLDNINNFPKTLETINNHLIGLFEVSKLVGAIKDGIVKIQNDNLELFAIYSFEYEVYPNLFYWNELCINPVVKLKEKDDK